MSLTNISVICFPARGLSAVQCVISNPVALILNVCFLLPPLGNFTWVIFRPILFSYEKQGMIFRTVSPRPSVCASVEVHVGLQHSCSPVAPSLQGAGSTWCIYGLLSQPWGLVSIPSSSQRRSERCSHADTCRSCIYLTILRANGVGGGGNNFKGNKKGGTNKFPEHLYCLLLYHCQKCFSCKF